MEARAEAMDELEESGAFENALSDEDQLDRELDALSADREVEAELDQLRDESGGGETTETESADATESEVETTGDGGTSGGTESDEEPADPAVEAELEQLRDDDSQ